MIARLGGILFRMRSWTPIPLVIVFLVLARPTIVSLLAALPMLLAGEGLRLAGLRYLDAHARGSRLAADRLATGGPYRFIRHPLYAGNLLLVAGLVVGGAITKPLFVALIAVAASAQYAAIIAAEESFLAARFGHAHAAYAAAVPLLVPTGCGLRACSAPRRPLGEVLRAEFRTLHTLGLFLAYIVFRAILDAGA